MSEGLTQLASLLRERGLSTAESGSGPLAVTNPVSSSLREVVSYDADRYVTGWGYEVGQQGEEPAVADRLAFLLGVPSGAAR